MLRLEVLIASKYIVGIKSILHVAVIMYLKVYLKKKYLSLKVADFYQF